jgi:dsDNA-specific endonuclease/ATPase MutS2
MEFFIGEKVGFVHETGFGIIKKEVSISKYLVENEFGIELTVLKANLVKIYSENYKGRIVVKDFENSEKLTKAKAKKRDILEIDLHLEEFQVAQKNLTNAEILLFQLRKADEFVQKMLDKRVVQFIIIHGVGEGVLKSEVRSILTKYSGVQTTDADQAKYGQGATLVNVNYNLR